MLKDKLYPRRFPGMSGRMAAIVAYVLDEHWTTTEIVELAITSDGAVLAMQEGGVRCNEFIGASADLERNVQDLLGVAGLTLEERAEFYRRYSARVMHWRTG